MLGCSGPFPLNTGREASANMHWRGLIRRSGDAEEGGSAWGLVPFQPKEGFVQPGGCRRHRNVCVCVSASHSAPWQPWR